MKILVIDDEPNVVAFIEKGLKEQNYEVDIAYNGKRGLELINDNIYDIIILDVIMPKMSGIMICNKIRELKLPVFIIMLSALGASKDIVNGLDMGADDYITKPFKFKELVARIQAMERRQQLTPMVRTNTVADLEMNHYSKTVSRAGNEIKLTPREYYMLEYFIKNKGKLVSRIEIAEKVWENNYDKGSNIVDVYVNYLRNKIDKDYTPKLIHTVMGMGYIFKE